MSAQETNFTSDTGKDSMKTNHNSLSGRVMKFGQRNRKAVTI